MGQTDTNNFPDNEEHGECRNQYDEAVIVRLLLIFSTKPKKRKKLDQKVMFNSRFSKTMTMMMHACPIWV